MEVATRDVSSVDALLEKDPSYFKKKDGSWGKRRAKKKKAPVKKAVTKKAPLKRKRYTKGYTKGYLTNSSGRTVVTPYGTIIGNGDYFSPDYGSRLGSVLGEGVQGGLNYIADRGLSSIFGFGDYYKGRPKKFRKIDFGGMGPPNIQNHKECVILRHREYLGDLKSGPLVGTSTAFDLMSYQINPGNRKLFPFGSNVASNFQEYEFLGMVVQLKSLTSEFATTSVMGSYFIGTQYNAGTPPPRDKRDLENLEFSTSSKPSQSMMHMIECHRAKNVKTMLYVASDSAYNNGDPRFFDLGQLFIGSQGLPVGDVPIAEIWVSYEVKLCKPILTAPMAHCFGYVTQNIGFNDAVAGTANLNPTVGSYSAISLKRSSGERCIIDFPSIDGRYMINVAIRDDLTLNLGATFLNNIAYDGCSYVPWEGNLLAGPLMRYSIDNSFVTTDWIVQVTEQNSIQGNPSVSFDLANMPPAAPNITLYISINILDAEWVVPHSV